MADWPIGLSTGCFFNRSIFDVLDPIRNSGISVLEVCSSRQHLDYHDFDLAKHAGEEIAKRGLEVFSFHAPFGKDIDISAVDDGRRGGSISDVLSAVDAAEAVGARYFVLHPGPEQSERPPAEEYLHRLSNTSDSLGRIADRCNSKGMMLALENMLPHLLFGRMPDLFWILGSVAARNVGICLDTGHAFLAGALYSVIGKFAGHLIMMHAADNHGERDDHLPPGKGDITWERVVAELSTTGFTGPIILELAGHDDNDTENRLQDAVRARQFLRGICRKHARDAMHRD
jgi:sugar phosphate isomerase/epimerase